MKLKFEIELIFLSGIFSSNLYYSTLLENPMQIQINVPIPNIRQLIIKR